MHFIPWLATGGKNEQIVRRILYNRKLSFSNGGRRNRRNNWKNEGIFADIIVVDPPRKGCDSACLETMLKMQPEKIVYVSCDSATLARDLKILCEGGYEIQKVRGVDQFGHTVHVECVCLLSKV